MMKLKSLNVMMCAAVLALGLSTVAFAAHDMQTITHEAVGTAPEQGHGHGGGHGGGRGGYGGRGGCNY